MNTTNGNISKEGEHHYAQVQLPGGIVVKGTSTNLAKKDGSNGCLSKGVGKVVSFLIQDKTLSERNAQVAT